MIVYGPDKSKVYTTACSLCGRPKGDGWESFADHLRSEHTPDDCEGMSPTRNGQPSRGIATT